MSGTLGSFPEIHCLRFRFLILSPLILRQSRHLLVGYASHVQYRMPLSDITQSPSNLGGNGPFSLLITPVSMPCTFLFRTLTSPYRVSFQFFFVPQNISIPDSAIDSSSGNGSFSFQLTLPPGRRFILTMSDSTGFESGGTSDVLTVGSSISDASCDTTEPGPDFTFEANAALLQCR